MYINYIPKWLIHIIMDQFFFPVFLFQNNMNMIPFSQSVIGLSYDYKDLNHSCGRKKHTKERRKCELRNMLGESYNGNVDNISRFPHLECWIQIV